MVNVGKSLGRISIRALPDTRGFRPDLLRKLRRIEETTRIGITVDRARVDRRRIRESIERQVEGIDGISADADVRVRISKAKLLKTKLRKNLQEQFDELGDIRVGIAAHIRNEKEFQHQVKSMVREASRNDATIGVGVRGAKARAELSWLSRDRIVQIIPNVSKAAAAKAAATIAAISGGRVAFDWGRDLLEYIGQLDRKLPKIALMTTSLTTLGASLFGALSGIVGIGQGLVSTLPLLLPVPGLILNAAGSLAVLIVALKDAKKQLSPLADDMSELGGLMSDGFWERARDPIISLVKGLMPQLRTSFDRLARGVGGFTGALADAFGRELADGRLDAIFKDVDLGWRILSVGADGFAGAIVSLSEIAARYTPRLAKWFTRQAAHFDAWLEAIAKDGRLDQWINDGVKSMYQLWDATRGTAGVLRGIWTAADRAGSGGLKGFSEMLLRWSDIVNGPRFQNALANLFSGSYAALGRLEDGIVAFGDLIADNASDFRYFIATAGDAFGGLLEDIANGLNQPVVATGFREFIDGIRDGLSGFGDHLPTILEGFGGLLSTAGELARQLGPVLGTALGSIADILTPISDTLRETVLPELGPALQRAMEDLTPKFEALADKVGPVVKQLGDLAMRALPAVVEVLGKLADAAGSFLDGFNANTHKDRANGDGSLLSGFGELGRFGWEGTLGELASIKDALREGDLERVYEILQKVKDGKFGVMWQDIAVSAQIFGESVGKLLRGLSTAIESFTTDLGQRWSNLWSGNGFVTDAEMTKTEGSIRRGMGGGFSAMQGFKDQGEPLWSGFMGNVSTWATNAWSLISGSAGAEMSKTEGTMRHSLGNSLSEMEGFQTRGLPLWNGFLGNLNVSAINAWFQIVAAVRRGVGDAVSALSALPGQAIAVLSNLGGMLYRSGQSMVGGFVSGIRSMIGAVRDAVNAVVSAAARFFPHSPAPEGPFSGRGWTLYSGEAVVEDWAKGIRRRASAPTAALAAAMEAARRAASGIEMPGDGRSGAPAAAGAAAAGGGGNTFNVYPHAEMNEVDLAQKLMALVRGRR